VVSFGKGRKRKGAWEGMGRSKLNSRGEELTSDGTLDGGEGGGIIGRSIDAGLDLAVDVARTEAGG